MHDTLSILICYLEGAVEFEREQVGVEGEEVELAFPHVHHIRHTLVLQHLATVMQIDNAGVSMGERGRRG